MLTLYSFSLATSQYWEVDKILAEEIGFYPGPVVACFGVEGLVTQANNGDVIINKPHAASQPSLSIISVPFVALYIPRNPSGRHRPSHTEVM